MLITKYVKIGIWLLGVIIILILGLGWYFFYYPHPVAYDNFPLDNLWEYEADSLILSVSESEQGHLLVASKTSLNVLEATTGSLIWNYPNEHRSTPQSSNGRTFIVGDNHVTALADENGEVIWTFSLSPTSLSKKLFVLPSLVMVNVVSQEILALDQVSGELQWTKYADRGEVFIYEDSGKVYTIRHGIAVYDAKDGEFIWSRDTGGVLDSAYIDGVLYYVQSESPAITGLSGSCRVEAFDVRKQKMLWARPLQGSRLPHITVSNETLFVSYNPSLYAIDLETGHLKWQASIQSGLKPVVLKDYVFVLEGFSRKLKAVDVKSGEVAGYLQIDKETMSFVDYEIVFGTSENLYFSVGRKLYAYGK